MIIFRLLACCRYSLEFAPGSGRMWLRRTGTQPWLTQERKALLLTRMLSSIRADGKARGCGAVFGARGCRWKRPTDWVIRWVMWCGRAGRLEVLRP